MNILKFVRAQFDAAAAGADVTTRLRSTVQQLLRHGIKCNYDPPDAKDGPSRMILHTSRYNKRVADMASECNGLVLDYRAMRVVCAPPPVACANFNVSNVSEAFERYRIFEARDGTVVNLYYYDDRWCISTLRGIELNNTKCHNVTYQAAIDEVRPFEWSALDRERSYTMGFTHPAMHHTQTADMWYIASWHPEHGRTYDVPDNIGMMRTYESDHKKYPTLRAVQEACAAPSDTARPFWGVILRSDGATPETIYIESSLMRTVRTMKYDRVLTDMANDFEMTVDDYVFVRTLLTPPSDEEYKKIYPQHAALHTRARGEIDAVMRTAQLSLPARFVGAHSAATAEHINVWHRHLKEKALLPSAIARA